MADANKLSDMPDFNDATKLGTGKEMVERLTNLIAIFENKALDFSKNRAEGDDILGDAYEYLMRHFATESGKSKGQFYRRPRTCRTLPGISKAESPPPMSMYIAGSYGNEGTASSNALGDEIKRKIDDLSNAMAVERNERQQADKGIADQLKKAVAEGLPLGRVGAICFFMGIIGASASLEIASWFGGVACQ